MTDRCVSLVPGLVRLIPTGKLVAETRQTRNLLSCERWEKALTCQALPTLLDPVLLVKPFAVQRPLHSPDQP